MEGKARGSVPRVIARYLELYTRGDLSIADAIIAPEFVDHTHPELPPGPEGVKRMVAATHAAFPDLAITVEQVIAEGEFVAFRWTLRGTRRGPFAGVAPTGRAIALTGMDLVRVAGGRMAELWSSQDTLGLLLALGAVAWVRPGHGPEPSPG